MCSSFSKTCHSKHTSYLHEFSKHTNRKVFFMNFETFYPEEHNNRKYIVIRFKIFYLVGLRKTDFCTHKHRTLAHPKLQQQASVSNRFSTP